MCFGWLSTTSRGLSGVSLTGLAPSCKTTLSLWSMGPLGPYESLSHLACPRVPSRVLSYIIYTADLGPLLAANATLSQSYAHDLQAHLHCLASAAITVVRTMSQATEVLEAWMSSNHLCLNPSKTQFIWFGMHQQLDKIDSEALAQEFPQLVFSSSV